MHVFLRPALGDPSQEQDVTSYFAVGTSQATGLVPEEAPLADGAYAVRAVFTDAAGNAGAASASFLVDTQAPTATVQQPAADAFLATATPAITVQYQDEASGLDLQSLRIAVDGFDRTALFTVGETSATAQLPRGERTGGRRPHDRGDAGRPGRQRRASRAHIRSRSTPSSRA